MNAHRLDLRARLVAVVASGASLLASCGGASSSAAETPSTVAPSTTQSTVPAALAPLTGLPVSDPAVLARPTLVAKIDNHPGARPQSGLNAADIVFEENVEQITRFAAVFHSNGSDPVGPLRSGRTQDINLLGSFNKPLFVWSGGNARVTRAINASDFVNLGPTPAPDRAYYRDKTRKAPHNLYTSTTAIWKLAPEGSSAPQPQFSYRGTSDVLPSSAVEVRGGKVTMDGVKIYWEWDASKGLFTRWLQNNKTKKAEPHMDSLGVQIGSNNVVVIHVLYKPSKADRSSPEAQTLGRGDAWVLTDGHAIKATWSRDNRLDPFTITDPAGSVIKLTPGRTFVELARRKDFVSVPSGVDPVSVAWPNS